MNGVGFVFDVPGHRTFWRWEFSTYEAAGRALPRIERVIARYCRWIGPKVLAKLLADGGTLGAQIARQSFRPSLLAQSMTARGVYGCAVWLLSTWDVPFGHMCCAHCDAVGYMHMPHCPVLKPWSDAAALPSNPPETLVRYRHD